MDVSFRTTREDFALIEEIAYRAMSLANRYGITSLDGPRTKMDWHMDLAACHANGCPMKFAELLGADDANFSHDVFGIARHIDRETGKLGNCFSPRYARKQ